MVTISSINFLNYKTFKKYNLTLNAFNILVGPNNTGKSTILGSLKILSEGIKKAKSRNATLIRDVNDNLIHGYELETKNAPITIENVFFNYDDSQPAVIRYLLSNGCTIQIFFPEASVCLMNIESDNLRIRTTAEFKKHIDLNIGFVPVLSPIDQYEHLYQKETARLAITSFKASRNFRNIWYHYPENFENFRDLISSTWPGMDVKRPEIIYIESQPTLNMYCPENHIDRELFWAGYGFQIWCQMLTYIIKNKDATLFVIDEPDIYLHSDLQRQLLGILKELGPDIVIATHSTEIITEAELSDILIVNKAYNSAKRIKDPTQLKQLFNILGSNLNPVLTQIAKTKRVLFVEGKDFVIFSKLARILKFKELANRADFAVVPLEGFNPVKLRAFKDGIEKTVGAKIVSAVVFDRDYRSNSEVESELMDLNDSNSYAHIHSFKELENILLIPQAILFSINSKVKDYNKRSDKEITFSEDIEQLLLNLTDEFKNPVLSQLQSYRLKHERPKGKDESKIFQEVIEEFDVSWKSLGGRLKVVPGKDFISALNKYLQDKYFINLTHSQIISNISENLLPVEVVTLMTNLDGFRKMAI